MYLGFDRFTFGRPNPNVLRSNSKKNETSLSDGFYISKVLFNTLQCINFSQLQYVWIVNQEIENNLNWLVQWLDLIDKAFFGDIRNKDKENGTGINNLRLKIDCTAQVRFNDNTYGSGEWKLNDKEIAKLFEFIDGWYNDENVKIDICVHIWHFLEY